MTVSSTTTKNSYSGNASTTVFAYGFKIFDDDDITVIIRTDSTGAETTKTKTTHYTVSNVGNSSGGNVTFTSGNTPASGETVVLIRDTARTQLTDYTPNDPFPADSHEDALDKLTLITQELEEELGRSLKLSPTNTMTSTEFTVGATDRANKVLSFDASGELSVTQEIGTFKGNWAASTSYAVRDLVKDTSTNNIFLAKTAHTSSGSQPLTTNTDSAKWDLIVDAATATTSATAAASSATAAASSASTASTQASNASTSASTASTQATNSANSATASASSATAASNAQAAAEAALDTFDDRFLGAKSSDPSVDNDGNALIDGALYFDTTNDIMKVYDLTNTQWRQLTLTSTNQTNVNTVAGQISPTNNIATVATGINSGTFSGATTFAETYRVSANAPTTSLDIGDLWFDTTNNLMKVYGSSGFISAGSSVNGTANRFAWTVGTSSGSYDGSLTVFPATYDAGFADVFLNGVKLLVGTDVTATNGTSVTLASAAVAADIVEIVAYGTFTAATELSLLDNKKISLGTGQDLELTWDGTDGHITVAGTLNIDGSGETLAKFIDDGAVELYHNNAKKIETTATGVDVTGVITTDGLTTSADINFGDNDKAVFGAGSDLQIYHDGSNSYVDDTGTGALILRGNANVTIGKYTGETMGFFEADGAVSLYHNNAIKFATTATGVNVTGASASASTEITIENTNASGHGAFLLLKQANTNANSKMVFDDGGTESGFVFDGGANSVLHHVNGSERMRLSASGTLSVGLTDASPNTGTEGFIVALNNGVKFGAIFGCDNIANREAVKFVNPNGEVGSINTNGSATSYNTSSDYRLKTSVEYDWDATSRLKQLKPARFKWIVDGDDAVSVDGFLAHEVQSIVPESISGNGKDAMRDEEYEVSAAEVDADGNVTKEAVMGTRSVPDLQGIDQSKLVPLLCKTILELEARITALEAG
jgi:hypothetical protein